MNKSCFKEFSESVRREGGESLYLQIRDWFRGKIISGEWQSDEAFPNQEELARLLGVTHVTLRQGMSLLMEEGLVRRKQRAGTFVQPNSEWKLEKRTKRLGLILADQKAWPLSATYMGEVYAKICIEAVGKQMDPVTLQFEDSELLEKVKGYKLDGVISFPSPSPADHGLLERISLPKIILEMEVQQQGLDNIVVDSRQGVLEGTQELIRLGHRRLGYVGALVGSRAHGPLRAPQDSLYRLKAFREAVEQSGVRDATVGFHEVAFEAEDADCLVDQLLKADQLPTAMLAFDDNLAHLLFQALQKRKIAIPRDVSLLGFGDSSKDFKPGELATVSIHWPEMVDLALRRIDERIERGGMSGVRLSVRTSFKTGASIGPPPKGA